MAWDWDLTYLYKDFNDPAFAADMAELPELNKKLAAAVTADLPAKEKLEQGLAPSEAAKQAAAESGLAKRDIYRAILHDGGGADD